ncbi:MAG: hypothetical protein JRM77_06900 [Nitrososphaerota archaeon]|nr:hypothetical protein [Nitrososphaerota archaeon]
MNSEIQSYRPFRAWELKTSELTTTQRREARAFLVGSFGQKKCHLTGRPIVLQLLHDAYDIHHLLPRGSPGCNLLINLRLALHGPNANAGKPKDRKGIRFPDKNKIPVSATELLRQTVDYSQGSREMQANGEAEVPYRGWLWGKVVEGGSKGYAKQQAINSGAEKFGVSKQATRDYLDKMLSEEGPFQEVKENGVKYVRVKPGRLT